MRAFAELGTDILFLEAPQDEAEMAAFCARIPGPKMANMLEEGVTPLLPPERLQALGYRIAAYPLTLLNTAVYAMQEALDELRAARTPERRVDFATIQDLVGFADYDLTLARYSRNDPSAFGETGGGQNLAANERE
jgi:2-methylisocitrate lyase-like PEP mutase family enzyme